MRNFWVRFVLAAAIAFIADYLTKQWALAALVQSQRVPLVGHVVRLTLGYNTGVAFGMLAGSDLLVSVLSGLVLLVIVVWLVWTTLTNNAPPSFSLPLGLIIGGGAANFADRWPDGRVTDFIDVGLGTLRWPTFNVADACIVVAVVALAFIRARQPKDEAPGTRLMKSKEL